MKIKSVLPILLILFLLTGCVPKEEKQTFFAMDTVMSVTVYGKEGLTEGLQAKVQELEKLLSVTDPESEICKLNQNGKTALSPNTQEVLKDALRFCEETDGALDITVYPALQAWGFTTDAHRVPADDELAELLSKIDYRQVTIDSDRASIPEGVMVDLGAVAKGYTAQLLTQMLRDIEVESAMLDLGGNIQAIGQNPEGRPWGVAVQDPDSDSYLGVLNVTDKAVVTSGGYERNFTEDGITYHHILDPRTGRPAQSGLKSVTIVGESGLTCDAFSTALYVMGPEAAIEFWKSRSDFECILVGEDDTLYVTEGLRDSFTSYGAQPVIIERG